MRLKKRIAMLLVIGLIISSVLGRNELLLAKNNVKLNHSKITLRLGQKSQLKLEHAKGKVRWSSSIKQVASVNKKGVVTAKKTGTAIISAKNKKKTYKCKVVVIKNSSDLIPTPAPTVCTSPNVTPARTAGPSSSATTASSKPTSTARPTVSPTVRPTVSPTVRPTVTPIVSPSVAPKATPSSSPQIRTYGLNDEWVVNGQWKFRITGVQKHYKCNSYSRENGEEVVVISYAYENLGYTNSIQNLFMTLDRVYDSQGNAASSYPCTHESSPKVLDVGMKCTASKAFILPKAGSQLSVVIEQYTSNNTGKQSAKFVISYGSGQPTVTVPPATTRPVTVPTTTPTVKPSVTLSITNEPATIYMDETTTYTASTDPDSPVTWSSTNTSVATVDPSTGLVTPTGVGTTKIVASSGGKTADCYLYVKALRITVLSPYGNDLTEIKMNVENTLDKSIDIDMTRGFIIGSGASIDILCLNGDPLDITEEINSHGSAILTFKRSSSFSSAPIKFLKGTAYEIYYLLDGYTRSQKGNA
ncbi:MAG: Ig-like domain-containing protein [Eubacterium sp.]|nr:Ig-like domain-containing protein [Eubacterium sp.]